MGRKYKQLSEEERVSLCVLLRGGLSIREIGKELLRAPSTISREIRRHFPDGAQVKYLYREAQQRAEERRRVCRKRKRLKNAAIEEYVREKLSVGWSPEQIAGRMSIDQPRLSISHEAIYQYIYIDAPELLPHLARSRKTRQRRVSSNKRRVNTIPQRVPIEHRSEEIKTRVEFGHWELDTVTSAKGLTSLLVITERKSRFTKIAKLTHRRAALVRKKTVARLAQFPKLARRSITYDNGSENFEHLLTNRALGTCSFFCAPYHSWEKGTVENTIGLIRRIFPKSTNFDEVSLKQVKSLENRLNNRPRKCLNFSTPLEDFNLRVALES